MIIDSSITPLNAIIIIDTSIKNDIAMSILHMHIHNCFITKILYHAVHVTSTKAELFAIRCSINNTIHHKDISKIIVITNAIHVAKRIFNLLSHPYQIHTAFISKDLCKFFMQHQNNSIEFWECSSHYNWAPHKVVDKETKNFKSVSLFLCKISWDFSRKSKCNDIANIWKIIFQVSEFKGRHFLNLLNNDSNIIKLLYIKGGPWLKFFRHSNTLYTRAARAIINHAPIGKYRLRFFPREEFRCLCRSYPIKMRRYILHECRRFNKY